jgi:hypothetical protein
VKLWLHRQIAHRWFAWHPIVIETRDHKHVVVWMETVERYWSNQTWHYDFVVEDVEIPY